MAREFDIIIKRNIEDKTFRRGMVTQDSLSDLLAQVNKYRANGYNASEVTIKVDGEKDAIIKDIWLDLKDVQEHRL